MHRKMRTGRLDLQSLVSELHGPVTLYSYYVLVLLDLEWSGRRKGKGKLVPQPVVPVWLSWKHWPVMSA